MEVNDKFKKEYDKLKAEMLFVCIWKERPQGGYNLFDCRPFVALRKVINQGADAYVGKYIGACKKMGMDNYAIKNEDGTFVMQVTVDEGECYKPLPFFIEDGKDRIIVSNDLDEIAQMYLVRWQENHNTPNP